jgi:hypothetical protein
MFRRVLLQHLWWYTAAGWSLCGAEWLEARRTFECLVERR